MFDVSSLDLSLLPEINVSDVKILWINDWYDGPLEAIVEFRGNRCLLVVHDCGTPGAGESWQWVLFQLTSAQLKDEEYWWQLFVQHVSTHWDFTGKVYPEPSGQHDCFYAEYKKRAKPVLQDYEPIGWLRAFPIY